jgi:SAM-dependent methyltransferase
MAESIEFNWLPEEFDALYDACAYHDGLNILFDLLKKEPLDVNILEAGCGLGATVKYIADKGYTKVIGIEVNKDAVAYINRRYPELNVIHGDILNMPFKAGYFDFIASFGVVEHFPDGMHYPLSALYDSLKSGGSAVITVPCLNRIRKVKHYFRLLSRLIDPRKNNIIRPIFRKPPLKRSKYYVYPAERNFFEYRLSKQQFEKECKNAGFEIVRSIPICHIDGFFHLFRWTGTIRFDEWRFTVTPAGRLLNSALSRITFLHNHMHALILTKR